jgi:Ser-tRNA(Ala) deacylase AlaX
MSKNNKNLSIMEINQAAPKFQDVSIAPMHTAEHLLNATMVKTFGCPRSRNAHIEKKKSKCDYELPVCPTEEQIHAIEEKVNEAINRHLPVTSEFMTHEKAKSIVDLSKLPENASEMLRIVRIGDYDACACIGQHVENTSEIGIFKIISYDYADGKLRLRFKLIK